MRSIDDKWLAECDVQKSVKEISQILDEWKQSKLEENVPKSSLCLCYGDVLVNPDVYARPKDIDKLVRFAGVLGFDTEDSIKEAIGEKLVLKVSERRGELVAEPKQKKQKT